MGSWGSAVSLAQPQVAFDRGSLLALSSVVPQTPTVAPIESPNLAAVGVDGDVYQLLSEQRLTAIRVPVRVPLPSGGFATIYRTVWITVTTFDDEWTVMTEPPSGGILSRDDPALPGGFDGRTLRALRTGTGAAVMVAVSSDAKPYFNAEATPGNPRSYGDWVEFPFDDGPRGVLAVAAATTAGVGVVAFLAADDLATILLSYQTDPVDPTSWSPLTPLANNQYQTVTNGALGGFQGDVISLDGSGTANGVCIVVRTGDGQMAYLEAPLPSLLASAAATSRQTSWVTSDLGASTVAESLSPLGYEFALTDDGGLGVFLPTMTTMEWDYADYPITPLKMPNLCGYVYGFEGIDLTPLKCDLPALTVPPPRLLLDSYGTLLMWNLPSGSTQQVASQDVLVATTDRHGNSVLQVLTFPLTVAWFTMYVETGGSTDYGRDPIQMPLAPSLGGYALTSNPDATELVLPNGFGAVTDLASCLAHDGSELVFAVGDGADQAEVTVAWFAGIPPTTNGAYIQGSATEPSAMGLTQSLW